MVAKAEDHHIPSAAQFCLEMLARQYLTIVVEVGSIDKRIHAWHRSCEESRRLEEIPGIGPIVATALVAEIGDWKAFRSGRNLAAWIGLVPKHSTGGKERLGSITKQGNRYLRWLLVTGANRAAQTGRTRDRTRPMLQKRQKVLAKAPSTRDPKRTWRELMTQSGLSRPRRWLCSARGSRFRLGRGGR
jgi:transposase